MSEFNIETYKSNNRISQKKLYDEYSPRLYSICLRYTNDYDIADDILQNSFIKIFKNIQNIKATTEVSLYCWLKTIVVNTAITHKTSKHESKEFVSLNDIDIASDINNDDYCSNYDVSTDILLKIIQELPEGYRKVFNMYVIDDYSHKEIAEKLNISESTSKTQYLRAKESIKLKLKKYEYN